MGISIWQLIAVGKPCGQTAERGTADICPNCTHFVGVQCTEPEATINILTINGKPLVAGDDYSFKCTHMKVKEDILNSLLRRCS